jgi:TonB family protein
MKFLLSVLLLMAAVVAVTAQGDNGSAPVVWERYKFSNSAISIMLPKMPGSFIKTDACKQINKDSYFAYAENAVYELTVVEKLYLPLPKICPAGVPFSKDTFEGRLAELRNDPAKASETNDVKHGYRIYKFTADGATRWVVNDMEKKRWVEAAVAKRSDSPADEDKFIDSLIISMDLESTPGKQASLGSDTTLGDADVKLPPVADQPKTAVVDELKIIVSPRPSYTEDARKKMTQGKITLRVTLLANGGIGSIEVVRPLEGLNEQAIAAAKKIVFLPKRVNGVNVSVTKLLEYGFSIY